MIGEDELQFMDTFLLFTHSRYITENKKTNKVSFVAEVKSLQVENSLEKRISTVLNVLMSTAYFGLNPSLPPSLSFNNLLFFFSLLK